MPERIQLRRTKGWRKPEGAIVVSRPSQFGNPAMIEPNKTRDDRYTVYAGDVGPIIGTFLTRTDAHHCAVDWFRWWLTCTNGVIWLGSERIPSHAYADSHRWLTARLPELRGRDLCCWCPPEFVCHADVLLELANGGN